jgi:hypothetical protein
MAKALLFLQEHDIRDIESLRQRADETAEYFNSITEKIKKADKRMKEIKDLKKHIINYGKTRDVYVAYRKSGYSKKFYEANRSDIMIHKEAKAAFAALNVKKLPTIKELNREFGQLLETKKEAYSHYRKAKEEMKDFATARYDVERFLKLQEQTKQENEKDRKGPKRTEEVII